VGRGAVVTPIGLFSDETPTTPRVTVRGPADLPRADRPSSSGVVVRPAPSGPASLADFFMRCGPRLAQYFSGPLHWHEHFVPDLVQETFTRALASYGRFRGTTEPEAERWLYGIARNVHLQEVSRQVGIRLRKEVAAELARQPWLDERCHARDIRAALDELPLGHLEILRLVLEGLSSKEIAEELDLPEGTVASRLYRARERLRARLGGDW
jgi:RNA polymerase sigma-70 factor, ECF subfamily